MANNSGSQNQTPGASATYPITTDPSVSHSKLPDSRERARNQIVAIWSDRLQLISVLSTFSTSIDSLLFSLSTTTRDHSNTGQLMSAAFAGALIFHAAGAVLAFLGAFVLIRYRLADARAHIPDMVHTAPPTFKSPPPAHTHGQSQRTHAAHAGHSHEKRHPSGHEHASVAATPLLTAGTPAEFAHPPLVRTPTFFERLLHVPFSLSPDITIELVRPWSGSSYRKRSLGLEIEPGSDLTKERLALKRMLQRCHHACSLFVLLGFLLLIVGVVSFAWEVLDRAVSIFVSSCVAFSILLGIYVLT